MAGPPLRRNVTPIERRVPPNSETAEVAVLGGILFQQDKIDVVRDFVSPGDFYSPRHQKIFDVQCTLREKNLPIDPVTLKNALAERGMLDEIGGVEYIDRIEEEVYTAANIAHYATIVAEKALLRRLLAVTQSIQGTIFEGRSEDEETLDTLQIVDQAQRLVFDVTRERVGSPYESLEHVISDALRYVDERAEHGGGLAGLASGFADLDRLTNGFKPGELVIVAARPAMGKTSLALNVALNMAVAERKPVLFFSLEMSAIQLGLRLLTSWARIPADRVHKSKLSDQDYTQIANAAGELGELPLFVDDSAGTNVNTIKAKARRLRADKGDIAMIVVDYLQIMTSARRIDSREQQIAEISRSLKAIAKELECPVMALAQLNRALESRDNKRPRLSDLRESGALEQDADIVMFLYREAVYWTKDQLQDDRAKPGNDQKENVTELIIGKNRMGQTGLLGLYFHREYTRFESYELEDF
ncbi:MAG: replicative DNA helicase [Candidatus Lernaella stagnicola]|nr:replicative DNA helicase [Candidatus Lernaella stagnicola]